MEATALFLAASLKPVTRDVSPSSSIERSEDGKLKTSSFYLDSTGRSSISMQLTLDFPDTEALKSFLKTSAVELPSFVASQETKDFMDYEKSDLHSLAIEAKVTLTFGSGEAVAATVEGVAILASRIDEASICLDTEIVMKVSRKGHHSDSSGASVKTNLEVTATLSEKSMGTEEGDPATSLDAFDSLISRKQKVPHRRIQQTRLPPMLLHVSLTNAFSISVRSMQDSALDKTMISLTIRHSNTHVEPVMVTQIAAHPNHSRLETATARVGTDKEPIMADLRSTVRWGYLEGSEPSLPISLSPHEAISTIIMIDSTEDEKSRTLLAPISVSATVGAKDMDNNNQFNITVESEARWTTVRAAVEPCDAFKVDLSAPDDGCRVGSVFSVALKVSNLDSQRRELALEIAADDVVVTRPRNKSTQDLSTEAGKFGVRGLSDAVASGRDGEIIPVDTSLALGEVYGHKAIASKLRFIPLRAGTLRIPSFSLVDVQSGTKYLCSHAFRVVVE